METLRRYESPLGPLLLTADGEALTGLAFAGPIPGKNAVPERRITAARELEKGEAEEPEKGEAGQKNPQIQHCPPLDAAEAWLNLYFAGQRPDFTPPLRLTGTAFARTVWDLLLEIPYGTVVTYGELARRTAARLGPSRAGSRARMSAQAVGGALRRNPILILVPCHRVVGAGGQLTGYAGGLDRKARLLELEGAV